MYQVRIGGVLLPVTPSKIDWKYNGDNKTTSLINTGEINILRPLKLTDFSFEALLPARRYPFAVYDGNVFQPVGYYLEFFASIMEQQKIVPFTVWRTDPQGSFLFATGDGLKVTLEDYSVKENAGDGLDVVVSLKLKQYKEYATVKYAVSADGTAQKETTRPLGEEKKAAIPTAEKPKSYTVKAGDTLWAICKREYGDGAKCAEIAKLNGIANPNKISVGQVIRLA